MERESLDQAMQTSLFHYIANNVRMIALYKALFMCIHVLLINYLL